MPSREAINTRVVDMTSKTVLCDVPIADHTLGNSAKASAITNFNFFIEKSGQKAAVTLHWAHRWKRPIMLNLRPRDPAAYPYRDDGCK